MTATISQRTPGAIAVLRLVARMPLASAGELQRRHGRALRLSENAIRLRLHCLAADGLIIDRSSPRITDAGRAILAADEEERRP